LFLEYLPFILHGALVGVGSFWPLLSTKLANIKKLKTWMSYEILEVRGPKNLKKERKNW
jgi:hypothetical protein